ncbi:MAG: RNA 2',3'-cyclic phosphodiesterase [Nanoarchaeota archaeon]
MRVFISINLSEDVKEEVKRIQESLPEFEGKKTDEENLHLTLKFLGEVNEEMLEKIKDKLNKIKFESFEPTLDYAGFFDNPAKGIVWINLTNCDKLQQEIDNSLEGLFEKEKRFMSHLTIARVKKIKDKMKFLDNLSEIQIRKIGFIVDKFFLMQSKLSKKGPVYSVLEEFFPA